MSGASYKGSGDFTVQGMRVEGVARVTGRFTRAMRQMSEGLSTLMWSEAELVAEMARARMGELFRNPARMQAAIHVYVQEDFGSTAGARFKATISATGLPYLAIHEYGGTIMTPVIVPVAARALHFFADARAVFKPGSTAGTDAVFTQQTRAHPTRIPERSYLRYALAQRRSAIHQGFVTLGASALRGGP